MSNTEETVSEVKQLFFDEQLSEEQIMLEIYSSNGTVKSEVDELRLDFDRIFSKKQLQKKALIGGLKISDSADYKFDFSIKTILGIKNEQRYLNATFKGYVVLIPRNSMFNKSAEPMLFASLKNNNFYLLNMEQSQKVPSKFKSFINWIKKGISFKTYTK
jgi:hypothetical protein